jgi:hypothetical protein
MTPPAILVMQSRAPRTIYATNPLPDSEEQTTQGRDAGFGWFVIRCLFAWVTCLGDDNRRQNKWEAL